MYIGFSKDRADLKMYHFTDTPSESIIIQSQNLICSKNSNSKTNRFRRVIGMMTFAFVFIPTSKKSMIQLLQELIQTQNEMREIQEFIIQQLQKQLEDEAYRNRIVRIVLVIALVATAVFARRHKKQIEKTVNQLWKRICKWFREFREWFPLWLIFLALFLLYLDLIKLGLKNLIKLILAIMSRLLVTLSSNLSSNDFETNMLKNQETLEQINLAVKDLNKKIDNQKDLTGISLNLGIFVTIVLLQKISGDSLSLPSNVQHIIYREITADPVWIGSS